MFSDNLAHKCCKAAGIRSKARKYKYRAPGEESIKYENLVKGRWNAKAPLQIVVSDMTILKNNGKQWEWTLLMDTFNNEIIAHSVSPIAGDNKPYYYCLDKLNRLAGKKEEQKPQVVFHTDQGPSTPQGHFATPMNIITYFVPCREGELQRIIL